MSRKDYELIARALRAAHYRARQNDDLHSGVDLAAMQIADALQWDNPRFDRDRFLAEARLPVDTSTSVR